MSSTSGTIPDSRRTTELTIGVLRRHGVVVAALTVLVVLAATWGNGRQSSTLEQDVLIHDLRSHLQTADMLHDGIVGQVYGSGLASVLGDERVQALAEELQENADAFREEIAAAVELAPPGVLEDTVRALPDAVEEYLDASAVMFGRLPELQSIDEDLRATADADYARWTAAFEALKVGLEEAADVVGAQAAANVRDASRTSDLVRWVVFALAAIVLTVLGLVWRSMGRSVRRGLELRSETERIAAMVENSPTSMMFCGPDQVIRYVNPASLQALRTLQHLLPCPVDEIVGRSIDVFHRDPTTARHIVGSVASGSAHEARIQLGPETLDLAVTAIRSARGEVLGTMMSWSIVTERLRLEREAAEVQRARETETAELQRRVDELSAVLARAAAGDLTVSVEATGEGAVRQIGVAVTTLLGDLRTSIDEIAAEGESLAGAAEELRVVSKQMTSSSSATSGQVAAISTTSEVVSASVERVAVAVEQMSASIREISKSAADAAQVAAQAVAAAQETNATVSKLGDSSAEIGQIVRVITGIAQQTNLLALNATIEAARAGEAGKGFAVVANEVKELAKETAHATEDISAKIDAIQDDTRSSVESITSILEIIGQIAAFQDSIASSVEQQATTTADIAQSIGQASAGSRRITSDLDAVAHAAAATAAGADDSGRAADELTRMANNLQQLVGRFSH